MRKLVMGCAVAGLIALSPKSEASSPALLLPFPMVHEALPRVPKQPTPRQIGWASWYGTERQGNATASGELFDHNGFTAAHRNLPMGTMVRVTNLRNFTSTVLRITDRGPGFTGRVIDVSEMAARKLGFMEAGLTRVEVDVLSYPAGHIRQMTAARCPQAY